MGFNSGFKGLIKSRFNNVVLTVFGTEKRKFHKVAVVFIASAKIIKFAHQGA